MFYGSTSFRTARVIFYDKKASSKLKGHYHTKFKQIKIYCRIFLLIQQQKRLEHPIIDYKFIVLFRYNLNPQPENSLMPDTF